MNGNQDELRAIRIVKNLFKGVAGDEITRDEVKSKLSDKTFYNYSPLIQKYGLVSAIQDDGQGKKIRALRLTDKGKMMINQQATASGNSQDQSLNLDALGEYIEQFNRQSKYWELKLVRKEVAERR